MLTWQSLWRRPFVDRAVLTEALGDDPPPVARIAKEARPPRDTTQPTPAELRRAALRQRKARPKPSETSWKYQTIAWDLVVPSSWLLHKV